MTIRAWGWGRVLQNAFFWAWDGHCTHEFTETVVSTQDLYKFKSINIPLWVGEGIMQAHLWLSSYWQLMTTGGVGVFFLRWCCLQVAHDPANNFIFMQATLTRLSGSLESRHKSRRGDFFRRRKNFRWSGTRIRECWREAMTKMNYMLIWNCQLII